MALDTFIAGRYSATYPSAQDIGITSQGYEVQQDAEMDDIGESDAFGLTVIDAIFRGGQCHCQFESLAYKVGSIACFWPWGAAQGANGVLGTLWDTTASPTNPPGQLASNAARVLTLTNVVGTPAAGNPTTLAANFALLAKNNNARLIFNTKLRTVPIRMRLYPYQITGPKYVWFTLA